MDGDTQQRQTVEGLSYANIGAVGNAALGRFFDAHPDRNWPRRACLNPRDAIALHSEWMAQFGTQLQDVSHRRSQRMELCGRKVLCTPRVPVGSILFE